MTFFVFVVIYLPSHDDSAPDISSVSSGLAAGFFPCSAGLITPEYETDAPISTINSETASVARIYTRK